MEDLTRRSAASTRRDLVRKICGCVICKGPLTWESGRCVCPACELTFSYANDTPVLLPPDIGYLNPENQWAVGPTMFSSRPGLRERVGRIRGKLEPTLVHKTAAGRAVVTSFLESFGQDSIVLNVGGGATAYGANVVNVEIQPGATVDVVGVAEALPIQTECCDGLSMIAVLEHVRSAERSLVEARRVLKPGGRILIDVPFIQGYHAAPGDYRRFTEQGLRAELEDRQFRVTASGVSLGPGSAMSWVTAEFLALLLSGRSATGYRAARALTGFLAAPLKYTDVWLAAHPLANRIPSGVWAIAER